MEKAAMQQPAGHNPHTAYKWLEHYHYKEGGGFC
jgi:hypothetical protein